ncbi:MAG: hypothetical protein C0502_06200 [Opitutus sp.]|nr:hypothetical protein [Opitutus sp.]
MSRFLRLLSPLVALAPSAFAQFSWNAPATANSGATYFVSASATFNLPDYVVLYKNGYYFTDGTSWAGGYTSDTGAQVVIYDAEGWDVWYNNNYWGSRTVTIVVPNNPPSISLSAPGSVNVGQTFAVTTMASDPDGDLNSMGLRWFGYGLQNWWALSGSSASEVTYLTAPSTPGTMQLRGEVFDNAGNGTTGGWYDVTVNAIPTTFTFSNLSHTYDGSAKTAAVTASPSGATFTTDLTKGPAAGSYTVTATATGGYSGSGSATLTITPASVSFSLSSTSFTYNGGAQGPSIVASPAGATYSTSGTLSATNAGGYSVTATASGNYTGGSGAMGWNIAPLPASFSFSGGPFTYTGGTHSVSVSVSPAGATYSASGTWSASAVGNYTATASASGNYTGSGSYPWSITAAAQAPVTISPATLATEYGNTHTFTAAGGSGTGAYVWGGDATGTGTTKTITFNTLGARSVNVYRQGDGTYGNSNTASATVQVSIDPSLSIIAPTQAQVNETIQVGALVSDSDGDLRKATVKWKGAIAQQWTGVFSYGSTFVTIVNTGTALGYQPVVAEAEDSRGVPTGFSSAQFDVNIIPPNTPPTISGATATVVSASQIQFSAQAQDADANLGSIRFYVSRPPNYNGYELVGTVTVSGSSAIGNYTWQPSPALTPGAYYMWARASDTPHNASDSSGGSLVSFVVGTGGVASLTVTPAEVPQENSMTVAYQNAPTANTWIGLYNYGAADSAPLAQQVVPNTGNGTVYFSSSGLALGQSYHTRMFSTSDTSTRIAQSNSVVLVLNPAADSDGDGVPNGIEQKLGTNMNSPRQDDSANSTQLKVLRPH